MEWLSTRGESSASLNCRSNGSRNASNATPVNGVLRFHNSISGCTDIIAPFGIEADNHRNFSQITFQQTFIYTGAGLAAGEYKIGGIMNFRGSRHLTTLQTDNNAFTNNENRRCFAGGSLRSLVQVLENDEDVGSQGIRHTSRTIRPNQDRINLFDTGDIIDLNVTLKTGNSEITVLITTFILVETKGKFSTAIFSSFENDRGNFRISTAVNDPSRL